MRRIGMLVLPVACAIAFLGGCDNAQKDEMALLKQDNEDLRKQLADRNEALESKDKERLAAEARADAAARSGAATAPADTSMAANSDPAFANIHGVTATRVGNEVHVAIEGDVLFDSGRTSLKGDAKKSLDRVASALREKYPGREIRVVGYTDTDPIRRSGFKSNYHLGFDRAFTVREYLVAKGLESKKISLASYGPDMPLASKEKSRRVEVIVIGA